MSCDRYVREECSHCFCSSCKHADYQEGREPSQFICNVEDGNNYEATRPQAIRECPLWELGV
jgi:hypothetical protein